MGGNQDVKLVIEDEAGATNIVPIEIGDVTLGRDADNVIRLDERNVSRHHARIFRDGSGRVFVEDLGSYNGVLVGEERINRAQAIEDGAKLQIGGFRLEIKGLVTLSEREETTQRNIAILAPALPGTPLLTPLAMEATRTIPAVTFRPHVAEALEPAQDPLPITPMVKLAPKTAAPPASFAESGTSEPNNSFRLLGLTGPFLGKVWPVLAPETVVGRSASNGIALNHRSVSRHHARLKLSDGRLRIIDLGSSNGILISGETYKEAELRAGDIVELGHILLRVCAPGDLAVLSAQEQALGKQRPKNRWSWLQKGAAALVVLVLLGSLLVLARRKRAAPPPLAVATAQTPVQALMEEARKAAATKQWPRAATLAQAALALAPENAEANTLAEQATRETQTTAAIDEAKVAVGEARWSDAYNALMQAPKKSSDIQQWRDLMAAVQPALESERIGDARQALQSGDLDEAQALVDEVRALEPNHKDLEPVTQALTAARHSAEAEAKAQITPSGKSTHGSHLGRAKEGHGPTSSSDANRAQAAYNEGLKLLGQGQASRAIARFSRCTQADKKFALCYRALGIAHAKAKNGPEAIRNYRLYLKVSPGAQDGAEVRQMIQQYERPQARP